MQADTAPNKILDALAANRDNALLPANRAAVERMRSIPSPVHEYYICFTPRSGSTWLNEILTQSQLMGVPGEWFNPGQLAKNIVKRYPCADLPEYIDCIKRKTSATSGVFGAEISFFQYEILEQALAACDARELVDLGRSKLIYLWRQDLLAQAVSLYRATETGMFHSVQRDAAVREEADFAYSENKIWKWMLHLLQQELGWVRWLSKRELPYLNLSYEELWSSTELTLARLFQYVLGDADEPRPRVADLTLSHRKIANAHSESLVQEFYAGNAAKVEFCLENRGKLDATALKRELKLAI